MGVKQEGEMTDLTTERVRELLKATEDTSTAGVVALINLHTYAPDLARALLEAWEERDHARIEAERWKEANRKHRCPAPVHTSGERARIVAWLRESGDNMDGTGYFKSGFVAGWARAADAIERGEHEPQHEAP